MARTTRPLTNTEVLRSKATNKDLTLHDGDGLFMVVKTTGKKLWRFRYQRPATNQRTMMGPGAYPALSLADARRLRAEYLSLLANGIDPQTQTEQATEQQQIALDSIFLIVTANWFALKQASVTPDYALLIGLQPDSGHKNSHLRTLTRQQAGREKTKTRTCNARAI